MDRKDTSNDITEKNSNKKKKNILCNLKKYDGTIHYACSIYNEKNIEMWIENEILI